MQQGIASHTAYRAGLARAVHQRVDHPRIFEDSYAARLLRAQDAKRLERRVGRGSPIARAMRMALAARSRVAEDALHEAVWGGAKQYVILGAGFDTFAFRSPYAAAQLRVFEVDHPDTQAAKRELASAAALPLPAALTMVPVDFARDDLATQLEAHGFDFARPAFFSLLGVSMYLPEAALVQTLATIARRCAPGSQVIFDYLVPPGVLPMWDRLAQQLLRWRVARLGEPIVTFLDPEQVPAMLRGLGFREAVPVVTAALVEKVRAEAKLPPRSKPPRFGMARMVTAVV